MMVSRSVNTDADLVDRPAGGRQTTAVSQGQCPDVVAAATQFAALIDTSR